MMVSKQMTECSFSVSCSFNYVVHIFFSLFVLVILSLCLFSPPLSARWIRVIKCLLGNSCSPHYSLHLSRSLYSLPVDPRLLSTQTHTQTETVTEFPKDVPSSPWDPTIFHSALIRVKYFVYVTWQHLSAQRRDVMLCCAPFSVFRSQKTPQNPFDFQV